MAKSSTIIIILASALCLLSLVNLGECRDRFFVEGSVYCDTCRAQFMTRLSRFMAGATVRLECREVESGKVTLSKEAVTDGSGGYSVEIEGDHEDESCEVVLARSSDPECGEIQGSSFLNQAARVSVTRNNGIVSPVRTANPLGFLRKQPLPECGAVLHELELDSLT
ncbi:olee1-like protein [Prosopis cineraria]|uniref:olee1-like protein n=1 Tax=Prosopis cineraria TaxID=364024 RepID=UPI00240F39D5|nr:olee1-like protein [Prosopis cineraria]